MPGSATCSSMAPPLILSELVGDPGHGVAERGQRRGERHRHGPANLVDGLRSAAGQHAARERDGYSGRNELRPDVVHDYSSVTLVEAVAARSAAPSLRRGRPLRGIALGPSCWGCLQTPTTACSRPARWRRPRSLPATIHKYCGFVQPGARRRLSRACGPSRRAFAEGGRRGGASAAPLTPGTRPGSSWRRSRASRRRARRTARRCRAGPPATCARGSQMMNSMNRMKPPSPNVRPNSEICSSVKPNMAGRCTVPSVAGRRRRRGRGRRARWRGRSPASRSTKPA